MTTYTGSYVSRPARSLHEGAWVSIFEYNNGVGAAAATTISNGDAVIMGKIAHGTTIISGYVVQSSAANETGLVSVGIDDSLVDLLASTSTSNGEVVALNVSGAFPYTVSVSSDNTVRYQLLKLAIDADFTTTTSFKIVLTCARDVG